MQKDRNERYSTVAELESDLKLHLLGEPIKIIRQTFAQKLKRLAARYTKTVVLSSLAIATLIAVSVVSVHSTIRANQYSRLAAAAESAAKEQTKKAESARQRAELEKTRFHNLEEKVAEQNGLNRNQTALIRAVAKFNRETQGKGVVSLWLRGQYQKEIENLLPDAGSAETNTEDSLLLDLVLQEQRAVFGTTNKHVANTIDLLGEQCLNNGQLDRAADLFRESLFIRTELGSEPKKRIRTMILLAKTLIENELEIEAQSYTETARQQLRHTPDSRLSRLLENLIKQNIQSKGE